MQVGTYNSVTKKPCCESKKEAICYANKYCLPNSP